VAFEHFDSDLMHALPVPAGQGVKIASRGGEHARVPAAANGGSLRQTPILHGVQLPFGTQILSCL